MAIEIGSTGGGNLPVNSMLPINSTREKYIAEDKTEWLQSGIVAVVQDGEYPEATKDTDYKFLGDSSGSGSSGGGGTAYTGNSFSVGSQDTFPKGMTWDGTNFWVTGDSSNKVYQYTAAGSYTGTNFSVSSQDTNPYGIAWDGSHLWVLGISSQKVYQYTA